MKKTEADKKADHVVSVQKHQAKMSKKTADIDKLLPTAYAFINNGIQANGALDVETLFLVEGNGVELIKSAEKASKRTIDALTVLETEIAVKIKDVFPSVAKRHRFEKLDKLDRLELDIELKHIDDQIKRHEEEIVFLDKKKCLLDGSQLYLALDMAKNICTAHTVIVGSTVPIPAILQSLGVTAGGGGGAVAGGGGGGARGRGGGASPAGGEEEDPMEDLDSNGEAFQFRNQYVVHLSSNMSTPVSVKENESNPETACADCGRLFPPAELRTVCNPAGTGPADDFMAVCGECAVNPDYN